MNQFLRLRLFARNNRGGRWIRLLAFAGMAWFASGALASSIMLPTITTGVATQMYGTLNVRADTSPYYFSGLIQWEGDVYVYPFPSDIYFGVQSPDRGKVWTWAPNQDGIVTLNEGIVPFARASKAGRLSTGSIEHIFTGSEPSGMYLIFMVMVTSGGDPTDSGQWIRVGMSPFFFKK